MSDLILAVAATPYSSSRMQTNPSRRKTPVGQRAHDPTASGAAIDSSDKQATAEIVVGEATTVNPAWVDALSYADRFPPPCWSTPIVGKPPLMPVSSPPAQTDASFATRVVQRYPFSLLYRVSTPSLAI